MPDRRSEEVVIPIVRDQHVRRLVHVVAMLEALADGRAPQVLVGVPVEDWSRFPDEAPYSGGPQKRVDLLSGAGVRAADLSLVAYRCLRRITALIRHEIGGYFDQLLSGNA